MKWMKFKLKTITEAEDIIISTLYDIGLEGAQIEDKIPLSAWEKEQMFVDIPPACEEDDGVAYLSFFVEEAEDGSLLINGEPTDKETILKQVEEELEELRMFMEIGEGTIRVEETEDIDWINNWKEFFHQFYIDDLLVIPSWEEVKDVDKGKKILHIDPGTAFGTGMHETTQLCIRQIRKYLTPETTLLDVGCGSGILSIIALMYGAKKAVGTDLDPCAVEAVRQNMETNGIRKEDFTMMIGNIITEKEVQDKVGYLCYDIVVANILADVLVELTPVITAQMKPGAVYITSGIIREKEETVVKAVRQAGLTIVEVTKQGEWVSVTARKA
ncbi:MAG: 50S ribosomal protein L11 methyltransferase [Lachnospiraceae bacterium]|nr:50S ribosomal protein L11 methyltransferase [Lachnospiraceae bacterium]